LLAEGEPLYGYVAEGYWTDVGSIAEYARANADLLRGKVKGGDLGKELLPGVWTAGDVEIDESARLTGPIFLGEGVKIGPLAEIIGPTVLRDYVSVDVGAVSTTSSFCVTPTSANASTLKQGATITMNRDQHRSSRMLKRGLMSGIVSAGVHVADLSQAPLPIGRFHTRRLGAAGGVHVRVSPFDVRVCDVKFFDRQA